MGGKGGNKGKGVGRSTRASQMRARQAASAASYASYKASQTPAGQAAAAASAAATRGMTAQQAYKAGYRGTSAFGGSYTGGNLGDPNSAASRSYKSTHGEAKYKSMVAEKGYSAPSYTAAGKAAATTRAEQRANNYSGFTEHLSQGESDKAFANLQKQLAYTKQQDLSEKTANLSNIFSATDGAKAFQGLTIANMVSPGGDLGSWYNQGRVGEPKFSLSNEWSNRQLTQGIDKGSWNPLRGMPGYGTVKNIVTGKPWNTPHPGGFESGPTQGARFGIENLGLKALVAKNLFTAGSEDGLATRFARAMPDIKIGDYGISNDPSTDIGARSWDALSGWAKGLLPKRITDAEGNPVSLANTFNTAAESEAAQKDVTKATQSLLAATGSFGQDLSTLWTGAEAARTTESNIERYMTELSKASDEALANREKYLNKISEKWGPDSAQAMWAANDQNLQSLITRNDNQRFAEVFNLKQEDQGTEGEMQDILRSIYKEQELRTYLTNREQLVQAEKAIGDFAKSGWFGDPNKADFGDVATAGIKSLFGINTGELSAAADSIGGADIANMSNAPAPSFEGGGLFNWAGKNIVVGSIEQALSDSMTQLDKDAGITGENRWQFTLAQNPDYLRKAIENIPNVESSAAQVAKLEKLGERFVGTGGNISPTKPVTDYIKYLTEKGQKLLGINQQENDRRSDLMMRGGSTGSGNQFEDVQSIIRQYQQQSSAQEQYDISQIWAGQSERDALYQQGLKDIASDQSLYTTELARVNEDQARYQAELDRVKAEGTEWGHDPEYQKYLTQVTGDVKGLSDYKTQTTSSLDELNTYLSDFKTSYTQDRSARTSAGIDYAQQWQSATRTPVMGIRSNTGFNVSKSPWDTFNRKNRTNTNKDFTYTALNV